MASTVIPYATQLIDDDDIAAVVEALKNPYLTQGPAIAEFENIMAEYCGAKYAVAVSSGTAALHIACLAAELGQGDEGITSPITFAASTNCMLYCGAKPVFADVDPETICISPQAIKAAITSKTKVIIPVHFAGQPADMVSIANIASENKLIVIEDAAHALGASYFDGSEWVKVGSCRHSDMTILSFHAVKHITTGEGGMVLTNSKELYEKLVMFRSHGITKDTTKFTTPCEGDWQYEMQSLGYNYRITDFQCALGISQFKKLPGFIARRREIVAQYNEAFQNISGLKLLTELETSRSAWHIYVIQVANRRKVIFGALKKAGLGVNVHYIPVPQQPYYQALGYNCADLPNATSYYEGAITIPLHPKMCDADVKYVIKNICSDLTIK